MMPGRLIDQSFRYTSQTYELSFGSVNVTITWAHYPIFNLFVYLFIHSYIQSFTYLLI